MRAWVSILAVNFMLSVYAHWILALQGWAMVAGILVQFAFGFQCGIELAHWQLRERRKQR